MGWERRLPKKTREEESRDDERIEWERNVKKQIGE